jgi:hypothetical protein
MVPDVMRQREPMLTTMFVGTCVWLLGRVGDAERVCRLQAAYEALGAGVGWEAYWTLPEGTNQQRQSALVRVWVPTPGTGVMTREAPGRLKKRSPTSRRPSPSQTDLGRGRLGRAATIR